MSLVIADAGMIGYAALAATERKMNPLIGKTLTGVKLAKDKEAILFQTTEGDIVARCDADCCSHTWVEGIENTIGSFPAVVTAADDIEDGLPETINDHPEHACLQFYGFKVVTDKGVLVIDYRNSSNGYYGGNLSWPGEYHYGGVYGQNNSDDDWEAV